MKKTLKSQKLRCLFWHTLYTECHKITGDFEISGDTVDNYRKNFGASIECTPTRAKIKINMQKTSFNRFFSLFHQFYPLFHLFHAHLKGGKSCGGLSTLSKNLSKNRIFHPFSMNFFFSYRESAMGNPKMITVLPENQVFVSII